MVEGSDVWRVGAILVRGMPAGKPISRRKAMDVLASNQTSTIRFLDYSDDAVLYAVRGQATGKDAARLAEHILQLAFSRGVQVQHRPHGRLKELVEKLSRFEQVLNRSGKL